MISEQRSGNTPFNASFQYDPLGNRLVANGNGALTTSTYNAANELMLLTPPSGAPTTSSYDSNGNLTLENAGGALTSYSWDFENRLIGVAYPTGQRQTFGYAANGQRTQLINPSTGLSHELWDGNNLLLAASATLTNQAQFTDNPGYWGGLVSQNQAGVSTFYGFDSPGNTRILVSSGGLVLATYLYEAFGVEILTPSAINGYWFGGQYGYQRDWPNRYHVRARNLQTTNGRWISRDPIGFDGGLNAYTYIANRPTYYTDPSGLAPNACGGAAGQCTVVVYLCQRDIPLVGLPGGGLTTQHGFYWIHDPCKPSNDTTVGYGPGGTFPYPDVPPCSSFDAGCIRNGSALCRRTTCSATCICNEGKHVRKGDPDWDPKSYNPITHNCWNFTADAMKKCQCAVDKRFNPFNPKPGENIS